MSTPDPRIRQTIAEELTSLPQHDVTELFDYRNGMFAGQHVVVY